MRVLLIVDDYLPDSYKAGAVIMHDLATKMVSQGHEVSVLTPRERVQPGCEIVELDGVKVLSFDGGAIKNTGKIKRAINETLLSRRGFAAFSDHFKETPHDLVAYYSPSIFWGGLVQRLKKLWSCPSYLIVRDIFPQWCVDEELMKEGSLICKYFRHFEKLCYGAADVIGVQSPSNSKYFEERKDIQNEKLDVLYNWCTPKVVTPTGKLRAQHGLEEKIIFFFGGNLGHAQDMGNMLRLAKRLRKFPEVHFVLVGQGDEVPLIEAAIAEEAKSNVTYLPPVNQDEYLEMLSEVDVGLFSLHRDHKMDNIPGKILGYLACKKPILGSVNPGNDVINLIENGGAGYVSCNGEDEALYENAVKLLKDKDLRLSCGVSGESLLNEVFSTEVAVQNILKIVK